jgi:hypothetical protein
MINQRNDDFERRDECECVVALKWEKKGETGDRALPIFPV